jgi:hypothetical protein
MSSLVLPPRGRRGSTEGEDRGTPGPAPEYGIKEGRSVHDALKRSIYIYEIDEGEIVG